MSTHAPTPAAAFELTVEDVHFAYRGRPVLRGVSLAIHPGEVVSKLEILQGVWDVNYEGDENVVEVYVGYLRRKIDQPFDRQSIQTVRGVGYRLSGAGS